VEVLEVVDEAGGKVVGDAVDEDLVSQGLLANLRGQLFTSLCFLPQVHNLYIGVLLF
jgi:hypothetical protein